MSVKLCYNSSTETEPIVSSFKCSMETQKEINKNIFFNLEIKKLTNEKKCQRISFHHKTMMKHMQTH